MASKGRLRSSDRKIRGYIVYKPQDEEYFSNIAKRDQDRVKRVPIKYLGVHLDPKLNYSVDTKIEADKVTTTTRSLGRIMPNGRARLRQEEENFYQLLQLHKHSTDAKFGLTKCPLEC